MQVLQNIKKTNSFCLDKVIVRKYFIRDLIAASQFLLAIITSQLSLHNVLLHDLEKIPVIKYPSHLLAVGKKASANYFQNHLCSV